jgi:hypothetical protein|eukprot:2724715-Prymnesium_polylepis.3
MIINSNTLFVLETSQALETSAGISFSSWISENGWLIGPWVGLRLEKDWRAAERAKKILTRFAKVTSYGAVACAMGCSDPLHHTHSIMEHCLRRESRCMYIVRGRLPVCEAMANADLHEHCENRQ